MRVLLIGATGRVGSLTCRNLVVAGHEVIACARRASTIDPEDGVTPMSFDLHTTVSEMVDVFERSEADAIIFSAGSRGKDLIQTDAYGAIKCMEAARRGGIQRFILLGSLFAAELGRWEDPMVKPAVDTLPDYYVAKNMADQHLIHTDLDYTIIEPGTLVEGDGTGLIEAGARSWGSIPIPDVATCLADCLELPATIGKVYNIVRGGQPIDSALVAGV